MGLLKDVSEYVLAMAFVEGILKPAVVYVTQKGVNLLVKYSLNRVDNLIVDPVLREEWRESPSSFVKKYVLSLPNITERVVTTFSPRVFEEKTGVKYHG